MINISHVLFEIAHDVILQSNIDVEGNPHDSPPPALKVSDFTTAQRQCLYKNRVLLLTRHALV